MIHGVLDAHYAHSGNICLSGIFTADIFSSDICPSEIFHETVYRVV